MCLYLVVLPECFWWENVGVCGMCDLQPTGWSAGDTDIRKGYPWLNAVVFNVIHVEPRALKVGESCVYVRGTCSSILRPTSLRSSLTSLDLGCPFEMRCRSRDMLRVTFELTHKASC